MGKIILPLISTVMSTVLLRPYAAAYLKDKFSS